jgi:hypothetical protein
MPPLRHIGLLLLLLASAGQVRPVDPLLAARDLYNQGRFDEAIAAAARAITQGADRDTASVVLARAHLERFRLQSDAADLDAATDALKAVDQSRLPPADRIEWLVGLGLAVYLDERSGLENRYGAAADLFETALDGAEGVTGPAGRDRILEWWCGALDRQAQFGPASARGATYARVLARVDDELARNDRSPVALYWRVAAARGTGDLDRAWGAAVAAWLRARFFEGAGAALRADLDRFVSDVLLPERAEQLAPGADPRPTLAQLEAGWEAFKARWQAPDRP